MLYSKLIIAVTTVAGITAFSRILGFIRDILFAAFLGATSTADAFIVAFRIPNLLRRLFAEGAFNSAFLPLFTKYIEDKGKIFALNFAGAVASYLLIALAVIVVLGEIYMELIVSILAPGYKTDLKKFNDTIYYGRLMFPYIISISISALLGGILNSIEKFAAWAFVPVVLNVFMITAMLISVYNASLPVVFLAWSVPLSGVANLLLMAWIVWRSSFSFNLRLPKFNPRIREFLVLFAPGILGAGIIQINQLIGTIFASNIPGAVSWLYYADRVAQLPLGIVGIAISTALLPILSKYIAQEEFSQASAEIGKAIFISLIFSIPSVIALVVIPDIIINVLFNRGSFGLGDSRATSVALAAYALGIPAFMLSRILSVIFFARRDTLTPVLVALASLIIHAYLAWLLVGKIGHIGVALALSISSWANTFFLLIIIIYKKFWYISLIHLYTLIKLFFASIFMGVILVYMEKELLLLVSNILEKNTLGQALVLLVLIFSGIVSYFISALFLGVFKYTDLKRYLKK